MYDMKKIVVKQGSSLCVIFTKQEREIYNIDVGDIIDIGDIIIIKKKEVKKWHLILLILWLVEK